MYLASPSLGNWYSMQGPAKNLSTNTLAMKGTMLCLEFSQVPVNLNVKMKPQNSNPLLTGCCQIDRHINTKPKVALVCHAFANRKVATIQRHGANHRGGIRVERQIKG